KLGRAADAQKECDAILELDPTNAFAQAEKIFLGDPQFELLDRACARHEQGYLELACEYLRLSALSEANRMIERSLGLSPEGRPRCGGGGWGITIASTSRTAWEIRRRRVAALTMPAIRRWRSRSSPSAARRSARSLES